MPRRSTSQTSPFGVRRPSDGTSRKLSKFELLFVAFAVLALIYLGSLGPKPDPWLEIAKAQLQFSALTCSTCGPMQPYNRNDQRFAPTPDSPAAIREISGSALDTEVVEPNAVITPNAGELPKAIEELPDKSLPEIATAKVDKETETSSPDISVARPVKNPASEVEGHEAGSSIQNPHVQRRTRPTTMSVPEPLSSSRYHQVPKGTEKMFDQNWQSKAFPYE